MKRVLFFIVFMSSVLYGQGIYLDLDIEHIGQDGWGQINYNFYTDNCTYVQYDYNYKARIQYPNGNWSDWNYSEIGGWWINKAGTYKIHGDAWAYDSCLGGAPNWRHTTTITIQITDNYAPAIPQNLQASQSQNNHPLLTWNANTEGDMSHYEIWKKGGNEGGDWHLKATSSGNSYEDPDETVVTGGKQANEGTAYYKIKAVDINGNKSSFSSQVEIRVGLDPLSKIGLSKSGNSIEEYMLLQNYPNPFNPSTSITFQIKEKGFVSLKVYNVLGKLVLDLINETKEAGEYSVTFDASDLPSGVYIYSLIVNDFVQNRKMTLMK